MSSPFEAAPEAARAWLEIVRPPELLSPSEFAERYRYLKEGTTARPGKWSNDFFPYLVPIMDAIEEAIRTGRRGVVLMKSGQGGGSEAMINALFWLKVNFAGPALYLISKDDIAKEFSHDRFDFINRTCAPVAELVLTGRGSGETIHVKRYTNGKLSIVGGRSVLNLESQPYRIVFIDEYDSLMDEIPGKGDPLANAEIRTDAFPGQTLIVAFAHPTTDDRGAGRLYYERSDQRRAHVTCCHCGEKFWMSWDHVSVVPEDGQTVAQAERDPACYVLAAPCCGTVITDGQRFAMARLTEQISTLPEEEARKRHWIGVHFNQLLMNKPLSFLAEKWIEGLDDEGVRRVFVNKRMGDVYRAEVQELRPEDWRACVVIPRKTEDPEAYSLGEVPPGVFYLTAGQDSRQTELHWAVWGWGLVRDVGGYRQRCAWLIDCGVVEREKTPTITAHDLSVFDSLLYERAFPRTDGGDPLWVVHGYHDMGWCPDAVLEFCERRPGRSVPARGESLKGSAASKRAPHRWGLPQTFRVGDAEAKSQRPAWLNTFVLKQRLYGMVGTRFEREDGLGSHGRIVLPQNVPNRFVLESSSERLVREKGELVWKARGPNHFSDCNVQALGAAINLNPFVRKSRDEHVKEANQQAEAAQRRRIRRDRARVQGRGGVRRRY